MYKQEEQANKELSTQPSCELQPPVPASKHQALPYPQTCVTEITDSDAATSDHLPTLSPLLNKQSNTSDNNPPTTLAQQLSSHFQQPHLNQLIMLEDSDDNFAIGDDAEANIGRLSINLQIKDTFNVLRQAIEKLLNEEQVSIQATRMLPKQLEDDFYDFVGYIKEKIVQIKAENNLSFIMAEVGDEPEVQDISLSLQEFITKESIELSMAQKLLEEKEILITSLLNEKTEQQNTLNEQQVLQQQLQKLHLQQYSVMKSEIKHQKQSMDMQLMQYQSLRNGFKRTMSYWIDDGDNGDDFEDNLNLIASIYRFNPKERQVMQRYLDKYRRIKNVE